jgi:hypothetical protein
MNGVANEAGKALPIPENEQQNIRQKVKDEFLPGIVRPIATGWMPEAARKYDPLGHATGLPGLTSAVTGLGQGAGLIDDDSSALANAHRKALVDNAVPYARTQLHNVTTYGPPLPLGKYRRFAGKVVDTARSVTPIGALMTGAMYAARKDQEPDIAGDVARNLAADPEGAVKSVADRSPLAKSYARIGQTIAEQPTLQGKPPERGALFNRAFYPEDFANANRLAVPAAKALKAYNELPDGKVVAPDVAHTLHPAIGVLGSGLMKQNAAPGAPLKMAEVLDSSAMYHGSSREGLRSLKPHPGHPLGGEEVVFGTPDRGLAVSNIPKWTDDDFEQGRINDEPWEMREKYPGAFQKLFGKARGTLYTLPSEGFRSDPRLMRSEFVNSRPVKPIGREKIRDVLKELRLAGWKLNKPDGQPLDAKTAGLLDDVQLQPHQSRLADEASRAPLRKLLVHALGSGKTLTSIAASEAGGDPYTAVVPAALRENFKGEQRKFTDGQLPSSVMSYSGLGSNKPVANPQSLVFDEAHRLRNPESMQSQRAQELANHARQVLLLSGTPVVNRPGDLAVPTNMLTGSHFTPESFEDKFVGEKKVSPGLLRRLMGVKPGTEPVVKNPEEFKALLKGHVDWYEPDKSVVPVNREDVAVDMGVEQSRLYRAMWEQLPWYIRWKLKNDFPMSRQELARARGFLVGPRQVSLSTLPYMKTQDPHKAFQQSTKLRKAFELLGDKLKDERTKALVFSNFVGAGLTPYAAALQKANVPHAVFHGGLSDQQRKQLVEDYNTGKTRVALLGPSGTEGLSFKGTQLIQLLDPYWNPIRGRQAVGRGLRFDSHGGLPEDLQNVHVQRFLSRLPLGFKDRLLSRVGLDRSREQLGADDHLAAMEARKGRLNQKFVNALKDVGTRGTES